MLQNQPSMEARSETGREQCGELKSAINNLQQSIKRLAEAVAMIESDRKVIVGLPDMPKVSDNPDIKNEVMRPSIIDQIRESAVKIDELKMRLHIVSKAF